MSARTVVAAMPPVNGRFREAWVGLFVIVSVIATWFVLATMTKPALFRGRYIVRTNVPNAAGIRKGDPVQMRGVNIGRVIRFGIRSQGVELRLEIEGEYAVPSDSRVELKSSGLLAGMVAEVVPGTSPRNAVWGDELPGANGLGPFNRVDSLAGEAEKVTARLQRLMSDETIRSVQDSSGEMSKLLRQLTSLVSEQHGELKALSASLRRSADGMEKLTTGPELESTLKKLDRLSGRIDGLASNLDRSAQSLDSILGRVERGEGTIGKLSKDQGLYDNLSRAAADFDTAALEMQKLVGDIRREPKKYISLKMF